MKDVSLAGACVLTDFGISRKSDCPIAFSAQTRKKNSSPSLRFGATSVHLSGDVVANLLNLDFQDSRYSTTYAVIGEPPSELLGCQDTVMLELVMSLAVMGPSGVDGRSEGAEKLRSVTL